MSTTLQKAIAVLKELGKYITEENITKLTPEEKKIKPADSPIIKRLKMAIETRRIPQLEDDLLQEQNKVKQLQLKNEKLTESYKKLIQHLADARQLVVHLQKDLSATQQDKSHIQKELTDALNILNKPTQEMGTQTDLTAEQISQMEKDIEDKGVKIAGLEKDREELNNQINQKETEINRLKEQVKDLEPNPTEKKLINNEIDVNKLDKVGLENLKKWLATGTSDIEQLGLVNWDELREPYKDIWGFFLAFVEFMIKSKELEEQLNKEIEIKNQLQTKYDLEVRSKEELSIELQKEKGWWDNWINRYKKTSSTPLWNEKKDDFIKLVQENSSLFPKNIRTINEVSLLEVLKEKNASDYPVILQFKNIKGQTYSMNIETYNGAGQLIRGFKKIIDIYKSHFI